MLAKIYHAVIPRQSAAGLCWTTIPSTPGCILPPPFMEDGPPPAPTEGGLLGSTMGPPPEAGVMEGHLEGVCLGALQGEPGLKSSGVPCKGAPLLSRKFASALPILQIADLLQLHPALSSFPLLLLTRVPIYPFAHTLAPSQYVLEPEECSPADRVDYTWECALFEPGQTAGQACSLIFDPKAAVLEFGPDTLEVGRTYRFSLLVYIVNRVRGASGVAYYELQPRLPEMVAYIEPVGQVVDLLDESRVVTLNATQSYDPIAKASDTYTFQWTACLLSIEGVCATPSPNPFQYLQSLQDSAVQVCRTRAQ